MASAKLVTDFWCKAAKEELYIWIERVASASQPADAPSRRVWPELKKIGFRWRDTQAFGVRPFEECG